jgi:plastocyanin
MSASHVHLRAYVWLVIILILAVGLVYFLAGGPFMQSTPQTTAFPKNAPAPTAADQVSAQQSFQYVVSYTVSGFHPSAFSMKAGQTVRFTNNSPDQILIQGADASSPALGQSMYWLYTAAKAGTVAFTAGNSSVTITVTQ